MKKLRPIKEIIRSYQVKAKKSLGQNFLIDDEVFGKIASSVKPIKGKNVLEIGPGVGSLTRIIIELGAKKLISVEMDESFFPILQEISDYYQSKELDIFTVHPGDALKVKESELFAEKFSIVANLPYNIATQLLFKWYDQLENIDSMYLMFQKEVAQRIVACPGDKDYGKLSVISQMITEPEILFDIEPDAFIPAPKITSSFVYFKTRKQPLYEVNLKRLNMVLQNLFNMRRKMLRKSLKSITPNPEELLEKINISPTIRPEELTIEQFCKITNAAF